MKLTKTINKVYLVTCMNTTLILTTNYIWTHNFSTALYKRTIRCFLDILVVPRISRIEPKWLKVLFALSNRALKPVNLSVLNAKKVKNGVQCNECDSSCYIWWFLMNFNGFFHVVTIKRLRYLSMKFDSRNLSERTYFY